MSNDGLPGRSGVGAPLPNPTGQSPRAAVPVSNARAEASRRNGAKSRGPKTPAGKARAAQNALKHGMRALQYVVLPDEDAVEFQALEAALVDELAPEGALQLVLARRVAVAAWRLARADRMEVELFEERRWEDAGVGMALIRDGNGTRSFETLLRYRSAAMAEFWRALKTLKALQAEAAAVLEQAAGADLTLEVPIPQLAAPAPVRAQSPRPAARRAQAEPRRPNEPEPLMAYLLPEPPIAGPALHEPAAPAPNEPDRRASGAVDRCVPSGRSCDRRRTHTIGSGRRRRGDRAPGHRRPARRAARPRRVYHLLSGRAAKLALTGPAD